MAAKNPLSSCEFYEGPNNREMPNLIKDGRNPISPSIIYWLRLATLNNYLAAVTRKDQEAANAWKQEMVKYWDQYIDTGFGVARHPDKGAILVPNARCIRDLNLQTKLSEGDRYAIMPEGMFEELVNQGHAYTNVEIVQNGGNKWLTQEQAVSSPFLKDLIPDGALRNASIVNVFDQYQKRFLRNYLLMGVFFPEAQKEPVMGLFDVGRLEDGSGAGGRDLLDFQDGRLGGVLPEVAEGDVQKLEHIVQYRQEA